MNRPIDDFATRLTAWQQSEGRHDLPWQGGDPYRVWVSEVMLQQTQVDVVIPYFQRFLARFPNLHDLAAAPSEAVLACWSGLGYYARARNLHAAARRVVAEYGGDFPRDFASILALPGIGRSTAAAICAFCYQERRAILDGNVKRVLCRYFGIEGWPGTVAIEQRLWALAESLLPGESGATDGPPPTHPRMPAYTQAIMDLGASVCRRTRPACGNCPVTDECTARRTGRQMQLPTARPVRVRPQREVTMLILWDAGAILLEQRPAAGIWGGMWSLPECTDLEDIAARLRNYGCTGAEPEALPTLRHGFTHFQLTIRPWRIPVQRRPHACAPDHLWLPVGEALSAPLPAPVRRLLQPYATTCAPDQRRPA